MLPAFWFQTQPGGFFHLAEDRAFEPQVNWQVSNPTGRLLPFSLSGAKNGKDAAGVSNPTGRLLPFSQYVSSTFSVGGGGFQTQPGGFFHLACYPCSIASEAVSRKSFREPRFLGYFRCLQHGRGISSLAVTPPVEYPERLCTKPSSSRLSEIVQLIFYSQFG